MVKLLILNKKPIVMIARRIYFGCQKTGLVRIFLKKFLKFRSNISNLFRIYSRIDSNPKTSSGYFVAIFKFTNAFKLDIQMLYFNKFKI